MLHGSPGSVFRGAMGLSIGAYARSWFQTDIILKHVFYSTAQLHQHLYFK